MTASLSLVVSTPSRLIAKADNVVSLRAEDDSGGFGILPGHADFVTVLPSSVLSWRAAEGPWRYCVVSSGVISVAEGRRVAVACRYGLIGDDLQRLQDEARAHRLTEIDADRRARVEQLRLHARTVRQMMRLLNALGGAAPASDGGEGEP